MSGLRLVKMLVFDNLQLKFIQDQYTQKGGSDALHIL
jgi:hypothetical protein